ncbi:MAG: hypothetical protein ACK55I_06460 [bacterium]
MITGLQEFTSCYELVFRDDWEFTKQNLSDEEIEYFISDSGNFLNPDCGDESNNWANRGYLLASYRKLVETMKENGVYIDDYLLQCYGQTGSEIEP